MGVVSLAFDHDLQRFVAIKALPRLEGPDELAAERWERERRAHGRLDHPNLVRAYCTLEEGRARFLVMEFVDGLSLQDLVGRDGPLPWNESCEAIRQAALGLAQAHEAGIVHRDVKPSNLMLDRRGTVKVLDLGIALSRREGAGEPLRRLTAEHHALGSLDFMAPEQLLNSGAIDGRADVHGLGGTLYFLVTGRPPHGEQPSILHALRAIETGVIAMPDHLPDGLPDLLRSALSRDPAHRPATPEALARALEGFAQGGAEGLARRARTFSPPPNPPARPTLAVSTRPNLRFSSRARSLLTHLSSGAIVLGGLGGLLAVVHQRGRAMSVEAANEIKPWIEIVYFLFEIGFLAGGVVLALAKRKILHKAVLALLLTGAVGLTGLAMVRRYPREAADLHNAIKGIWSDPTVAKADRPLSADALRTVLAGMSQRLDRVDPPQERRRKRFILAAPLSEIGRQAVAALAPTDDAEARATGLLMVDLDRLGLSPAGWDRLLADYPYGVRQDAWEEGLRNRVGRVALPHVRADWLLVALQARGGPPGWPFPIATESLKRVTEAHARDLDWPAVATELWLDPSRDLSALRARLADSPIASQPEVAGLLAQGRIRRDDWARVYHDVFEALELGTPVQILPPR
jgi:serine/threonine protein kinase